VKVAPGLHLRLRALLPVYFLQGCMTVGCGLLPQVSLSLHSTSSVSSEVLGSVSRDPKEKCAPSACGTLITTFLGCKTVSVFTGKGAGRVIAMLFACWIAVVIFSSVSQCFQGVVRDWQPGGWSREPRFLLKAEEAVLSRGRNSTFLRGLFSSCSGKLPFLLWIKGVLGLFLVRSKGVDGEGEATASPSTKGRVREMQGVDLCFSGQFFFIVITDFSADREDIAV